MANPTYIDWRLAASAGKKLTPASPQLSRNEIDELVGTLRDSAKRAHEPVAQTAGLSAEAGKNSAVYVVDRGAWIDVNVRSMEGLLAPVVEKITAKRAAGPLARRATAKVSGGELGGMMAYFSTKVLGQFDLAPSGEPSLLLVAPNIAVAERELEVDPADFRLWVCLHEEAHRVQFTAVDWLREYVIATSQQLMVDLAPSPDEFAERLGTMAKQAPAVFREGSMGLSELMMTPDQREKMTSLVAVMSLLEGHADVVMDDVGPTIVPSVQEIRRKFSQRRNSAGNVDRLLRRLLGMEAKMRQYRDGEKFVRTVQDKVGLDGFNAVWDSPETLPRATEIQNPQAWVERVHGSLFK